MKKLIIYSNFWIIITAGICLPLSGCMSNSGNIATHIQTTNQENYSSINKSNLTTTNNENLYTIGGTYDSMSNHSTNIMSCLKIGYDKNNVLINNPHALLNFTQEQDQLSVQKALNVSFSLKAGFGPFTIHKHYAFAKTSNDDAYTMNLNYIYQLAGTADFKDELNQQGESALTTEAEHELHYSKIGFRKMCGDHFISEATAGASVIIRLKLQFHSTTDKKTFINSFTQIGGLNNVLDHIKNNSKSINYSLSAEGIQVGGNPLLLDQLFLNNGGKIGKDQYPILDCGTNIKNTSSQCTNLINQVISYVANLGNQFNGSIDNYYLSQPTLSSWQQAGITPGSVEISPAIESAMYELTDLYQTDENNSIFIQNYKNMLTQKNILSPKMANDLEHLSDIYSRLLDMYSDPNYNIMDCYNGFISDDCIIIRDKIVKDRQDLLSNQELNNLLIYLISHQYLAKIWTSSTKELICEIVPITDSSTSFYAINCDGQITGSFNTNDGIVITQSLSGYEIYITNLHINYFDGQQHNRINYLFQDPLVLDNEYGNSFFGLSDIDIAGSKFLQTTDFFLVNILH